jgi:hypothetical protein
MMTKTEPRSLAPSARGAAASTQNWVLDPVQDALFIVATPILVTLAALGLFRWASPARALSWIGVAYVVFTVAHHLPTFIRVYGDTDLFRRFKWSFILGPLIPFTFAAGILIYINLHGYPLEYFFYLLILLALWDPWHFLMQHYGFMRIYDRNNGAPKALAARMDFWLCASWFAFIMLASGEWLPSLLQDLYARAHVPVILGTSVATLHWLRRATLVAAAAASVVYAGYTLWCWRRGYFVSLAKLGLVGITFGVMFFTYTPNAWILALAPAWSFKVGFATMGMVHDAQYLAIVWRYNRSLVKKPERARAGIFRTVYAKGGWLVAIGYVLFCLIYGEVITGDHGNRWLASVFLAVGFTSTLMHYYFDGFIWKVRHQQNRENLELAAPVATPSSSASPTSAAVVSWWTSVRERSAGTIFFRQLLYFGVPMTLLTIGAAWVWNRPADYHDHLLLTDRYYREGLQQQSVEEARLALAAMSERLPLAKKMAELQPTAEHQSELAYLLYRHSQYTEFVLPSLKGETIDREHAARHGVQVEAAMSLLQRALEQHAPLGQLGAEPISSEFARNTLAEWREVVEKCRAESAGKGS